MDKPVYDVTPVEPREVDILTREECLELLRSVPIGRVAVATPGAPPVVIPVNFVLDGEAIVFRSDPGTKLSALRGLPASFEVDVYDPLQQSGASVLVQGRAYEASHWEIDHVEVKPWAAGPKEHFVRIVPDVITGRRLRPTEATPDDRGYR